MTKLIYEVYCWVAVDPANDIEGVCAFMAAGAWMPLVAADRERLDSIRPMAEKIRRETGQSMRLIRLSVREVVEEMP